MEEEISDDEGFQTEHYHDEAISISGQPAASSISNDDIHHQRELSDPGDPHRSNKYHGPPRRWLSWTAADRDISRSVDLMRARDLSLHLYNAHHLKSRVEQLAQSNGTIRKSGQWPPRNWATWPVPAQDIHRGNTGIRRGFLEQDDHAFSLSQTRTDLKETLLACITKTARQRFADREYENDDQNLSSEQENSQTADSDTVLTSSSTASSDSDSESGSQHELIDQGTTQQARPLKTKRSNSNISLDSIQTFISEDGDFEPTTILDDETAMQIAEPSIEHIVSSLERLLGALHTVRAQYSLEPSDILGKPYGESRKRASERKKTSRQASSSGSDSVESDTNFAQPVSRYSKQHTLKRYVARSWKDILGTAAILGWNSTALRKAHDRCTILFGENMAMPTLDFDRGRTPHGGEPKRSRYSDGSSNEDEIVGGVHVNGYMCPIKRRREWEEVPQAEIEDGRADGSKKADGGVLGIPGITRRQPSNQRKQRGRTKV